MKLRFLLSAFTLLSLGGALAAPITFDFKDPKGVNNVVFLIDAPVESINGTASGVSGKVEFDPASPASLKGKITVAADTLFVPNSMMKEHLHGAQWMDVKKYPEISFAVESVGNAKTSGDKTTVDVTGTMTVKDKSKKITMPVELTYLKDKLSVRSNGQMQGDLLMVRAKFAIKRSDFNLNPGKFEDMVSDQIQLTLSLAGLAPK
jgi:polyisoprenoid-binding protein YceI